MTHHDLLGDPAEPVPCAKAGCWCETYDRATHGPLIDFGDNAPWTDHEQPTLLDGVAPFEGMTIGDLRLIVRLTADKPDDEPLAYSFDSDLDQLTGIQVV